MEAFLVSAGIVALAEMGDKTQLLSLVLAAKFRKPWPIVLGIFVATVVNHALAGAVGSWVTNALGSLLGVAWALAGGIVVYGLLKVTLGLRLSAEQEFEGADLAIHRIGSTPEREVNW